MRLPERSAYGLLTTALGTGLLALGLAFSIQMIAAVVGPFELLAPAPEGGAPGLSVWLPPSASRDSVFETRRRARSWRAALGGHVGVREVDSLAALAADGQTVLAIGDARWLTDLEVAAVRDFVQRGGAAIASGAIAVLGPDREPRGTAAMAELLGVARIARLEGAVALAAGRRGPLSAGLEPGQRLAVRDEKGFVAVDDAAAELRWADARSPERPLEPGPRGASLRRELGAGRLVWLGAGPDLSTAGVMTPGGDFTRLTAAAFAWAARQPYAEVAAPADLAPGDAAAASLDAQLKRLGPRRHLVEVTNRGGREAQGGTLIVYLNVPVQRVELHRTILQQDEPRFKFLPGEQRLEIRLPGLAAGASLAFTLDLDLPEAGRA